MDPSYEDEEKIVWLKDHETLARMAYVREKVQLCSIRTCPVKAPQGEMLIGYAVLKKTAAKVGSEGFRRRIFTLLPEDRPILGRRAPPRRPGCAIATGGRRSTLGSGRKAQPKTDGETTARIKALLCMTKIGQ